MVVPWRVCRLHDTHDEHSNNVGTAKRHWLCALAELTSSRVPHAYGIVYWSTESSLSSAVVTFCFSTAMPPFSCCTESIISALPPHQESHAVDFFLRYISHATSFNTPGRHKSNSFAIAQFLSSKRAIKTSDGRSSNGDVIHQAVAANRVRPRLNAPAKASVSNHSYR